MARDENMIAALKRERAVYASRGDDDRVAQVDEQLTHYGYEGEQNADPTNTGPQGRTGSGGRQSADATPAQAAGRQTAGSTSRTKAKDS